MKRNFDLKRQESKNLPPEKLQFFKTDKQDHPTEKGGVQE